MNNIKTKRKRVLFWDCSSVLYSYTSVCQVIPAWTRKFLREFSPQQSLLVAPLTHTPPPGSALPCASKPLHLYAKCFGQTRYLQLVGI